MEQEKTNRGFSTALLLIPIAIVAVIAIGYVARVDKNDTQDVMEKEVDSMMEKDADAMMEKDGDSMMKEETMMQDDTMMTSYVGSKLAGANGSLLLDFNQKDYEKAIAGDKLVVLYFYANWCPTCKVEVSSALYPAFNALTHDGVIGFRVNYNDNETDAYEKAIAKEFGVAYQHTKVFVKNGDRILKSPESWNKDRYISEINKAL